MGNQPCCGARTQIPMDILEAESVVRSKYRSFGDNVDAEQFSLAYYNDNRDYDTLVRLVKSKMEVRPLKRIIKEIPECVTVGQAVLLHFVYLLHSDQEQAKDKKLLEKLRKAGIVKTLIEAFDDGDDDQRMYIVYFGNTFTLLSDEQSIDDLAHQGYMQRVVPFAVSKIKNMSFLVSTLVSLSAIYEFTIEYRVDFLSIPESNELLCKCWEDAASPSFPNVVESTELLLMMQKDDEGDDTDEQTEVITETWQLLKSTKLVNVVEGVLNKTGLNPSYKGQVEGILLILKYEGDGE